MKKKILIHSFGILFLLSSIYLNFIYRPTYKLGDLDVRLKELRKLNVYKPGGCGIFALYISDYLDYHKLPYKIIYASWTNNPVPTHVLIQLEPGTYIDPSGFKGYGYNYLFGFNQSEHSKSELVELIQTGSWNKSFNRKDTTIIKSFLHE